MAAPKLSAQQRLDLVRLLAEGRSPGSIARTLGVSTQAVRYHAAKHRPGLDRLRAAQLRKSLQRGLFHRASRMQRMQARYDLLWDVVYARQDDPELRQYPGGSTGLLYLKAHTFRVDGENVVVKVPTFDSALCRAMQALEAAAAYEMGDRLGKRSQGGADWRRAVEGLLAEAGPVPERLPDLPPDIEPAAEPDRDDEVPAAGKAPAA